MNRNTQIALRLLGAASMLALAACDSGSDSNSDNGTSHAVVLNFTSDYSTGELRWMDVDSSKLGSGTLAFNQDSKLSAEGNMLFVLERYGADNLNCVDLDHLGDASAVKQVALEDGANPAEAVVVNGKGYLALTGTSYLLSFDPTSCALQGKIDLAAYQQKGEVGPHASAIAKSGNTLLVLLQRLQTQDVGGWATLTPTLPGLLVRIDATTGAIQDTVQLIYRNPSAAVVSGNKLYVASSGNTMLNGSQGGLEVVDLASGKSQSLADSAALGGGATYLALDATAGTLYLSINATYGSQPVKAFDIATAKVGVALSGVTNSFGELAVDPTTGKLFIGERGTVPDATGAGMLVFDNGSLSNTQVDKALPPYDVLVARW